MLCYTFANYDFDYLLYIYFNNKFSSYFVAKCDKDSISTEIIFRLLKCKVPSFDTSCKVRRSSQKQAPKCQCLRDKFDSNHDNCKNKSEV